MSVRRILTLLRKEVSAGARSFIFIFAIFIPLVITLVVSLVFGTLFSGRPKLGVADQGASQVISAAQKLDGVDVRTYPSEEALVDAVREGVVELGLVLPAGFDDQVRAGETAPLIVYVFGQSLLRDRAVLATSIAALIRDLAGEPAPVNVVTTVLGDEAAVPWEVRLLPFIVLMTIMIGGIMVPATSLVEEKQKRTLRALAVTPTSLAEVFLAKGLLGVGLSIVMAFIILAINRALGEQFALLLLVLALAGMLAAAFGVLLGAFIKDINTLFATIKGIGILLYAPAIVYLFPGIPEWIGRVFPTYYAIQPVVEIAQEGAGWAEVAPEVAILVGLILLVVAVIAVAVRRVDQFQVA